jgi:hypothetical protein
MTSHLFQLRYDVIIRFVDVSRIGDGYFVTFSFHSFNKYIQKIHTE